MKKTRKILSMILCSAMLVTVAPQTAFAEEEETGEQTGYQENTVETQAIKIVDWQFADNPDGLSVYEEDGKYAADVPQGNIPLDELASMLPGSLTAKTEGAEEVQVEVSSWNCPEYVADGQGAWPQEGEYTFTAEIQEGYETAENPAVTVRFADAVEPLADEEYTETVEGNVITRKFHTFPDDFKIYSISVDAGESLILDFSEAVENPKASVDVQIYPSEPGTDITIKGAPGKSFPIDFIIQKYPEYPSVDLTLDNFSTGLTGTKGGSVQLHGSGTSTLQYQGSCEIYRIDLSNKSEEHVLNVSAKDASSRLKFRYVNAPGCHINITGGTYEVEENLSASDLSIEDSTITFKETSNMNRRIQAGSTRISRSVLYNVGRISPADEFDENSFDGSLIDIDDSTIEFNPKFDSHYSWTPALGNAETITIDDSVISGIETMRDYGGIGGCFETLDITKSKVYAKAEDAPAIGPNEEAVDENISGSKITICDSYIEAASDKGAAIGMPYLEKEKEKPENLEELSVTISGDSDVTATSIQSAAIGGGRWGTTTVKDDGKIELVIGSGIGNWGGGTSVSDEDAGLHSLRAARSMAPRITGEDLQAAFAEEMQLTDNVNITVEGKPEISAKSGVLAIYGNTVTCENTNLVQNTMVTQTGSSQTLYKAESPGAVTVGVESIGELGYGYASVAATNLSAQTGADMKFGNSVLTDVTSSSDKFNIGSTGWQYFFTSPLLEIYGTVRLVDNNGEAVTGSAGVGTALKAGLTGLAPASVQNDSNDKVAYQWYRDGEEISGATGASYSLTQEDENKVVYCVVSGIGGYTGAVTSNAVTVTDNEGNVHAPELAGRTEDSITLKEIVGYEYKIVNGPVGTEDWQSSPEFTGLMRGQTYTFIQKNGNSISPAASFTTLSDAPQVDEFTFDYVNEKLKFQSGIYIYENKECTGEALNQNSGSLSIDISKYIANSDEEEKSLYAKYQNGNAVTEIKIPNRPSMTPLQESDVTAAAGSISFQGEKGVSYQLQDGNGYQAGPQKLGEGNTITYSGLIPGATYTLKMRVEASNAQPDPHFHSDQYDLQITLPFATNMIGTVLLPAGSTDVTRSYDLSHWLEDAEIITVAETADADDMINSVIYTGTILTVTGGSADADKEATLVVTAGNKKLTLTVQTVNVLAEEAEDDILWVRPFYPDADYIDNGKTDEELDELLDEKAEADGYDPKGKESFVLVPLNAVGADVAAARGEIEIHFTPTKITELENKVVALYMIPKTGGNPEQIPVEKNPSGGVDFTISGQGGYLRLYCEDGYTPEITIESIAVNGETTDTPVAGFEDQVSVTMKVASEKEDVPLVGTPTGTVTLYNGNPGTEGAAVLAEGTLKNGFITLEFTVDVEDLLAGEISLYAAYGGDNNYVSVNTEDAKVISVKESVPAAPVVTAVTADDNPYTSGTWTKQDHVTFTVSGSSAESGIAGYEYSTDDGKNWTGITPDAEGAYCLTVSDEGQTTYLFRVVTKAGTEGTASEPFDVKIDRTAPAAAIHVKDNKWMGFLNAITFGKFFKETVDVKITASDAAHASGVEKVEYMLSTDAFTAPDQVGGDWKELAASGDGTCGFSIEPNQKGSVYVRVTDHAGNTTVINSAGIVVYTDAAQQTQDISFTKLSKDDVSFAVSLNGNTVKSLTLESEDAQGQMISKTIPDTDYTVTDDGTITLKASYLQSLAAGNYTIRVDYNPMGETYVDGADNDAPAATTVALTVERVAGTVTIDGDTGKTYDGQPAAPVYTANNTDGDVVIEYKAKGADDAAYTTEAPENAGDYTVRITVKEDAAGNYTEASATQDFTIAKKELTVSLKIQDKQYDGLNTAAYAEGPELVGVVSGDNIELTGGTPTFDIVKTGEDIAVSFTEFMIGGDSAGNYTLTQPSGVTAEIYNTYEAEPGTDYTVNSNDWLREDFVITAKEGFSLSLTDTADGTWTDTLSASDETDSGEIAFYVKNETTGAISLVKTEDYKIDRTLPEGEIRIGENRWREFLNTITFGLFFKDTQTVSIESADALSGISKVEYAVSDKALSLDEVQVLTDWTEADRVNVTPEDGGRFIYYARITDRAGNVLYLSTDGAEFDLTAPVIEGITDGAAYCIRAELTVNDRNIDKVQINGKDATAEDGVYTLEAGEYTITALDKAGNATEVKVTVREAHDFIWITDKEATDTEAGLKHEECTVCGYAKDPVEIPAADDGDEDVVAQTGDPTDIAPWIMLMLASGAAVTGSWIWRRKRR